MARGIFQVLLRSPTEQRERMWGWTCSRTSRHFESFCKGVPLEAQSSTAWQPVDTAHLALDSVTSRGTSCYLAESFFAEEKETHEFGLWHTISESSGSGDPGSAM